MTMLCERCQREHVAEAPPALRCSAEAYQSCEHIAKRETEAFYAFALDSRNHVVSKHLIASGGLCSVTIPPRDVFTPLVRRRAAACILVHNHPSGDYTPSPEDQNITRRLVECGRLLGIPVLDHLIVAKLGYFSFRDSGCLETGVKEATP